MAAPRPPVNSKLSCEKCGSTKVSARYQPWFALATWLVLSGGRIPVPPPTAAPPCFAGLCPDAEHLHRTCQRCGFQWITPCLHGILGPAVTRIEDTREGQTRRRPTPAPSVSRWSWLWSWATLTTKEPTDA
jgi:hypothetical protein